MTCKTQVILNHKLV